MEALDLDLAAVTPVPESCWPIWSVPLPTKEFELTTVNGPLKPLPFCLNVPLPVPGFAAVVLTSVKLPLRLEKFHNIEKLPFTLPFVLLASKVPL